MTGDDLRTAIAVASDLSNPRLSEVDWDAVAAATVRPPGDEAGLRAALTKELIYVIEMESSGRVLNLTVEQRAERWAIGLARAALAAKPDQEEPAE